MRCIPFTLLLCACAHLGSRADDPGAWLLLQSEHFDVRTDVPAKHARQAVAEMELVRNALADAGASKGAAPSARYAVVLLANQYELKEFAPWSTLGFAAKDVFGEPLMVVTADADIVDDVLFKHELVHLFNGSSLLTRPPWIDEGLAAYYETLVVDRAHGRAVVGQPDEDRLELLAKHLPPKPFDVLERAREIQNASIDGHFRFETWSWLWVHWLTDTRRAEFAQFLQRLASGEGSRAAFDASFPMLREQDALQGMKDYLQSKRMRAGSVPLRQWSGAVTERPLAPAAVFALRANLLALHPSFARTPEGKEQVEDEARRALAFDPGDPVALEFLEGSNPKPAIDAHPGDWRSWVLYAERNGGDRAALDKAFALAPDNATVLLMRAFAEARAGDLAAGLRDATRAAQVAPGRLDVLEAYAQLAAASGDCARALTLQRRAIDSGAAASQATQPLTRR